MDERGQFGIERVFDLHGREFVSGPQYVRSLPLSSMQLKVPFESRATWYTTASVNSGYLEFKPHAEDKVISVCQTHRAVFTAHCLEDVNNEVDGDMKFQIKDLPTCDDFYPALHRMIKHKLEWGPQYQFYGRATFEIGVAEWTKRVMSDFGDILHKAKIYGAIAVSQYPYECCPNIWRAFCELWGPLCNTFHHGNGEMGISLYDMKVICGLPILGDVQYEEFIPQNKDLHQNRVYPPTITELLKIHSQLCIYHNQSSVSWAQWIGHFYREKVVYKAFGDGKRKPQDQTLRAPEITLRISNEGRLAAFLAFWLSRFVLPSVNRHLRPETFYMACLMAQGVRVSLAPTVLGYIYHGLGEIATHSEGLGSSSASLPIHYVIGWLGEHIPGLYLPQTDKGFVKDYPFLVRYAGVKPKDFRLNHARIMFRSDKELIYRPTTFIEDEGRSFADTKDLSDRKFEFLVCIRSVLLPVRVNNNLWLEPYYPNRFARQFGFDQGVPSNKLSFSVRDRHKCGMEDLARTQITLLRRDTTTGFYIPRSTRVGVCTWWYCKWWMGSSAPYMGLSVARIFLPSSKRLERHDNVFVVRPENQDPISCQKEASNKRSSSCSDNKKSPKRIRSQNLDNPVDDGVSSSHADAATLIGDLVFPMNEGPSEQGSTMNFPSEADDAQEVSNEPNDAIGAPDVNNKPNETDDIVEDDCPLPLVEYFPSSPYVQNFIHRILGPSVAPRRRRFIAEEMQDIFDRISSSKSPIDLLVHRDHILGALGLLWPMINTLKSGQTEFQEFATIIQHIFELATSFSRNVAFIGEYAHIDVDRINALITQYEQCFATIKTMSLRLTELNSELADANAIEVDVEKAEKEAEEATKKAHEMRQQFESKTNALKERAKDLQQSLDQQFDMEIGLRHARIDANEAMLPKLIEARNLGFSQEKEIRQLVSSLISLCSRVE